MSSTSSLPEGSDPALTVLSRLGLQEDLDTFRSLLVPFDDQAVPVRFSSAVGLVGVLMTKSGFSRSVVMTVVRELMKSGMALLDQPGACALVSFDGTKLYIPGNPGGCIDTRTLKPTALPTEESLTATVFSVRRAYAVCEGL